MFVRECVLMPAFVSKLGMVHNRQLRRTNKDNSIAIAVVIVGSGWDSSDPLGRPFWNFGMEISYDPLSEAMEIYKQVRQI